MYKEILVVWVKMFVLLTPFFILSVFVGVTSRMSIKRRKITAIRTTLAIWFISMLIYFIGEKIFWTLGLTLDAFRIGAGLVLLLSGLDMVRSSANSIRGSGMEEDKDDPSVVPLAIPCAIGPGTTGALLMMGISSRGMAMQMMMEVLGICLAIALIGIFLYFSMTIERLIKQGGLIVLSKVTGLFLVTLAIQIIVSGIKGFFGV